MNNIKKITIALISILIIIPLMGIGYIYFKLNSMYDKEEAKQINTTIEESEKNKKNGITNILFQYLSGVPDKFLAGALFIILGSPFLRRRFFPLYR